MEAVDNFENEVLPFKGEKEGNSLN